MKTTEEQYLVLKEATKKVVQILQDYLEQPTHIDCIRQSISMLEESCKSSTGLQLVCCKQVFLMPFDVCVETTNGRSNFLVSIYDVTRLVYASPAELHRQLLYEVPIDMAFAVTKEAALELAEESIKSKGWEKVSFT